MTSIARKFPYYSRAGKPGARAQRWSGRGCSLLLLGAIALAGCDSEQASTGQDWEQATKVVDELAAGIATRRPALPDGVKLLSQAAQVLDRDPALLPRVVQAADSFYVDPSSRALAEELHRALRPSFELVARAIQAPTISIAVHREPETVRSIQLSSILRALPFWTMVLCAKKDYASATATLQDICEVGRRVRLDSSNHDRSVITYTVARLVQQIADSRTMSPDLLLKTFEPVLSRVPTPGDPQALLVGEVRRAARLVSEWAEDGDLPALRGASLFRLCNEIS